MWRDSYAGVICTCMECSDNPEILVTSWQALLKIIVLQWPGARLVFLAGVSNCARVGNIVKDKN